MTVDEWVYEAVESFGSKGATLRQIQRFIDERHFEELAIDTLETALASLTAQERLSLEGDRYLAKRRTSTQDALKKLFGDT